ncbi:hypothetical protein [Shewanella sp.]|uniref:hypothetical protein n=1 Tax=Shewanella sp. TaxID=50422 RepID=UPI00405437D1
MLDARLSLDNEQQLYSIVTFVALSDADIDRYRQHLYCEQCGGKAYFRKQSVDGKSACFGSRYHSHDCDQARLTNQSTKETRDALELDKLIIENKPLVLDFSAPCIVKTKSMTSAATTSTDTKNTGQAIESNAVTLTPSQAPQAIRLSMSKLLNSLLKGSNLATAETLIEIDAGYQFKAKNLFVNFANAHPSDSIKTAKPKMYWGTLSHTDAKLSWLNPADCDDIGIPLGRHRAGLLKRFDLTDKRDFEGAGIILFGKCYWNKDKSRKIIELWNSERVFISPAIED